MTGIDPLPPLDLVQRLPGLAAGEQRFRQADAGGNAGGSNGHRPVIGGDRLLQPPGVLQRDAQIEPGLGMAWVRRQRCPVGRFRAGEVAAAV